MDGGATGRLRSGADRGIGLAPFEFRDTLLPDAQLDTDAVILCPGLRFSVS
jgi:hypothetical protein